MVVDKPGPPGCRAGHPAKALECAQVSELAEQIQAATQRSVQLDYVDQGCTGEKAADAAAEQGIEFAVVEPAEAKRGFVLFIAV